MPERTSDETPAAAALDAADPYQRERQTFPVFDEDQIARAKDYGRVESMPAGTVLFERGQRAVDFFLVLAGSVELFDTAPDGSDNVFTVHRARQFTGELDLFNGRKILVGGRTGEDSEILRVPRNRFQKMVSSETDLGETIMRAFILRRTAFLVHDQAGVVLFGEPNGADVLRIRRFLSRNGYPYRFIDATGPDALGELPPDCEVDTGRLPAVVRPNEGVLHRPSTPELADALGLTEPLDSDHVHDLAVIGAGPSGLSASVYAASENLDTVVIEQEAPGGQAGTSSRIENYLGFPTGISGQALAGRAWIQSQKFGARFVVSRAVSRIDCETYPFRLTLDDERSLLARAVIVASGATYRTLALEDYEKYEGQGIHYAASAIEAQLCTGEEVIVVGGGNSAGQAAVFLSRHASHVHVLVRSDSLASSMSDYLVRRIDSSARITLHTHTEIEALHGERLLERVTWVTDPGEATGAEAVRETRDVANVFVMIGALPNSGWLEAKAFNSSPSPSPNTMTK